MTQMLFYENVVPVSPQTHGDLCVERVDYKFAANVNSVPISAVEIPAAALEYTIVFAGEENAVRPFVVLGLQDGKNEYVKEDGKWSANYVPLFVRRYPFVFAQKESTLTLCLDEKWEGCNREGRGQRLFDDKGERTEYLANMLKFLEESQGHFMRTKTFCDHLKENDLLESTKADFTFPGGEKKSLRGFMAVNREKVRNLSPEKLSELAKTNELELIYNLLVSMNNFRQVVERSIEQPAE